MFSSIAGDGWFPGAPPSEGVIRLYGPAFACAEITLHPGASEMVTAPLEFLKNSRRALPRYMTFSDVVIRGSSVSLGVSMNNAPSEMVTLYVLQARWGFRKLVGPNIIGRALPARPALLQTLNRSDHMLAVLSFSTQGLLPSRRRPERTTISAVRKIEAGGNTMNLEFKRPTSAIRPIAKDGCCGDKQRRNRGDWNVDHFVPRIGQR